MTVPLLRLLLIAAMACTAAAQTKLLRFPDIHEDKIVFSYAGDLWLSPATGGTAKRLTAHPGLEPAQHQVPARRPVDRLHRTVRRR